MIFIPEQIYKIHNLGAMVGNNDRHFLFLIAKLTRKQESIAASQTIKFVKVSFIFILLNLKSNIVEMLPSRPNTVQTRIPQPQSRYSSKEFSSDIAGGVALSM